MYKVISLLVLMVYTASRSVLGCSVPEGGFKSPEPEDIVSYSDIVAVGNVTAISPLDPLYGDNFPNMTYGATVDVFCSYKGGPLPSAIKIGGAGFVPGHCTSKDLVPGQHYVLFLRFVEFLYNSTGSNVYEQTETAVPKSKLGNFLGVCDLNMQYPVAGGNMAVRQTDIDCPQATKLSTCKRRVYPSNDMDQISTVNTQDAVKMGSEKGTTTPSGGAVGITSSLTFLVLFLTNVV
ncbi:uncharacterized protein LOC127867636 [Dreissena polymorpha]|uniref:Uncharacterized protein n=1 Tax=Dreissena polymorpha TaxID=45954 RepID=A0A9D4S6G5_DREPO|nr:uncharacterized protein LOC127867636 [Dreissena polymorpha]KAH3893386.1 hypothetical protein DPMN_017533 [Dreissena polymorpha]